MLHNGRSRGLSWRGHSFPSANTPEEHLQQPSTSLHMLVEDLAYVESGMNAAGSQAASLRPPWIHSNAVCVLCQDPTRLPRNHAGLDPMLDEVGQQSRWPCKSLCAMSCCLQHRKQSMSQPEHDRMENWSFVVVAANVDASAIPPGWNLTGIKQQKKSVDTNDGGPPLGNGALPGRFLEHFWTIF